MKRQINTDKMMEEFLAKGGKVEKLSPVPVSTLHFFVGGRGGKRMSKMIRNDRKQALAKHRKTC